MTSIDQQHSDPTDTWMIEVDGQMVPDYDRTLSDFNEGDVVTGTVVRVDKDEILVDIGYKSEGVIPISELSIRRSVNPDDEVALGDSIDALVLQKEDADGRLILSKKRARFEKAWRRIEAAAESGEPVEGLVIEVVKGGLIIDLGVRGFLPASLVDIRRVQDLDEYRDQTLRCKVIELNRSRNNVVLSRRAVLEEERREQRQQILDRLSPGTEVEGVISNIVDFGAFVDLDGIDGLIHISELSWSHVNHPSEVLEIGQKVRVKVLDVDRDRQRISLGLKQTQTDPWQRVIDETHQGDVVVGRITKVVTFGAFAEILSGVEGLIHISELADHHVENPRDVVNQGDEVNVKVIEIDAERRRLSLSLKRVEPGETVKRIEMDGTSTAVAEEPVPELGLSSEVFADAEPAPEPAAEAADESEAAETEPVEPEAAEADAVEPEAVEPEAVEADAAAPEAAETEPEAAEAEASEPEAAEPEASEPEAAEPDASEPDATDTEAAEPEAAETPAEDGASEPEEALAEE
jgi:small subunit ribosomal protein S1